MLFGLRAKNFLRSLPMELFDLLARPAKLPQEEREESWDWSHLSNFDSGLLLSNSWSQKNIIVKMLEKQQKIRDCCAQVLEIWLHISILI